MFAAGNLNPNPGANAPASPQPPQPAAAKRFAWLAFADILVFFGVLLVGFAYLWRRGDLEWVRSTAGQHGEPGVSAPGVELNHAPQPPPAG